MLKIERKSNESFEALMRRFRNTMKLSGKMTQAKKVQFFKRKPSKNQMRASKLMRLTRSGKIEHDLKTGKIKESDLRGKRKRRR